MTTRSLLLSWAFLSVCTLECMASSDSPRAGNSRRDDLTSLGNLLAESLRGGERPRRETSAPVKAFLDEYLAAKKKEHNVSMWNLLPINFARKDLRADSIEVLQPRTSGEKVLTNRATALHQFNFSSDIVAVNAEIVAAELRLKAPHSPRGMLFAYQLLEQAKVNHSTARRLLSVWHLEESANALNIVLDVTSLAKEWHRSSLLNHGIELEFRSETSEPPALPASPLLVLYINSKQNYQHTVDEEARQRRQATNKPQDTFDLNAIDVTEAIPPTKAPPSTEAPSGTLPCHVKELILTTEEMGLSDIIHHPSRIHFSFCSGHCHWPFPQNASATNAGRIQGRVAVLTGKVPEPCCAPKEYSSQSYLLKEDTSIRLHTLHEVKVLSCECR